MIPRLKPYLGWGEFVAALSPPRRDDVERFEQAFAAKMGQKHAVAFPYGRTGLVILLNALGFRNRQIICPAYTCVVVPHAIVTSRNEPVFVDSQEDAFNMNLGLLPDAITGKTGAIMATSIFGYPIDLDKLDAVRRKYPNIHIIQDCAHSFAAEWKGRPVQKEGCAALFGLNISKTLTSIFGGMITTDNEELSTKLKRLRDQDLKPADWRKGMRRLIYLSAVYPTFCKPVYGLINRLERSRALDYFVRYYDESTISMPSDYLQQMSPVEARVGRANVRRYEQIIDARRAAAEYYFGHLENRPDFKLPPQVYGATYSHFVIQVEGRNRWLQKGIRKGVQIGWLIEYNIPEMPAYGKHDPKKFPIAAKYARTTINLPVWGGKELALVVVKKLFG